MNKDTFFRLTLNKKLVAMMLFMSLSLISMLIFFYDRAEKAVYSKIER